ncbi:BQ2448_3004 [Microbotryum intermedium]|uniref:BQ2448_3004 protein n=1 Tax=Microbotryum intermedium TaxID=269621 RepID=A0A238FK11_9BASI|nr:BQ2448_3004 [Microbotryum intermedium]
MTIATDPPPRQMDVAMTCVDGRARLLFRTVPNHLAEVPLDETRDFEALGPTRRPSSSSSSSHSSEHSRSISTSRDANITSKKRPNVQQVPAGVNDEYSLLSSDPTFSSPNPKSRIGKKARIARSISESYLQDIKHLQDIKLKQEVITATPRKSSLRLTAPSTKIIDHLSHLLSESHRLPTPWLTMLDVLIEEGKLHLQAAELDPHSDHGGHHQPSTGNRTL